MHGTNNVKTCNRCPQTDFTWPSD